METPAAQALPALQALSGGKIPPHAAAHPPPPEPTPASGAKGGIDMPFVIVVGCVLLWLLIGRKKEKRAGESEARRIGLDEGLVILESED